jgi:hypothetical protein
LRPFPFDLLKQAFKIFRVRSPGRTPPGIVT